MASASQPATMMLLCLPKKAHTMDSMAMDPSKDGNGKGPLIGFGGPVDRQATETVFRG